MASVQSMPLGFNMQMSERTGHPQRGPEMMTHKKEFEHVTGRECYGYDEGLIGGSVSSDSILDQIKASVLARVSRNFGWTTADFQLPTIEHRLLKQDGGVDKTIYKSQVRVIVPTRRLIRVLFLVLFLVLSGFTLLYPTLSVRLTRTEKQVSHSALGVAGDGSLLDIRNSTLGFEKIFVLNLPERSDKRDAISLAASLTDIDLEFIDAVKGESVPVKALPLGIKEGFMRDPILGSWRSHMNAIRMIVEQKLSSALIFEDDVDWDIRIKSQLTDFARGSQYLQHQHKTSHSPYGDSWDLLWLGHCHDDISKEDNRTYLIKNDMAVPLVEMLINNPELLKQYPPHTRDVHMAGSPICSFAYALSYKGAQKCKDKEGVCIDAHPAYFYHHLAAGGVGKNSDNNENVPEREKGETKNIQWSTRLHLEKLILGNTDFVNAYPDD